jgi:hypothetical protein
VSILNSKLVLAAPACATLLGLFAARAGASIGPVPWLSRHRTGRLSNRVLFSVQFLTPVLAPKSPLGA